MTAPRAARAVVALALLALPGCSSAAGTPAGAVAPAAADRSAAPRTTAPEPAGHEDDLDAPVDELVGHADHLDLSRLSPAKREAVEQELERRGAVGEDLWAAYGERLGAPPRVRSLAAQELAFVLLAGRADQLAEAVARTGSLAAARALPEVGPDAEDVEARVVGRCLAVSWPGDEFARSYGATVGAAPGGTLRERLQRVRVAGPGTRSCAGGPVSLSPDADRALG